MRRWCVQAWLLFVTACGAPAVDPGADTDVVDTVDTDAVDTDTVDSDVVDTDHGDTDLAGADSALDTGPHTGDPAIDTATPLADAVDGPFHGPWVARGGTRLEAVRATVGGPSQAVFSHFHDRRLNLDCRFVVAADGRLRCLPLGLPAWWASTGGCVRRGVVTPKTCPAGRATWQMLPVQGCEAPRYRVTALIPDPSVTTIDDVGFSTCTPVPLEDGQVFNDSARTATPAWRFARGIARVVRTGGDVDVVVVRSVDGAVEPIGLYDGARDAPCAPVSVPGDAMDEAWCAPGTDVALRTPFDWIGYSDATCTTESAAEYDVCDDAAPDLGLKPDGPPFWGWQRASLRRVQEIRALGEPVTHGYAWFATSLVPPLVECWETDFGTGLWQNSPKRALLDRLGPGDLPPLRQTSLNPGGPGAFAWVDADGRALLPVDPAPFAGADGQPCTPVWDATQTTAHCVPRTSAIVDAGEVFADPACTDRVVVARADAPLGLMSLSAQTDGATGCFGEWSAVVGGHPLVLGEPVQVDVAYRWSSIAYGVPVTCSPMPMGETGALDDPDSAFFRVSVDARPVSDWPELTAL